MDLSALKDRLIEAAAAAALLGGAAQLVNNTVDIGTQGARIERIEQLDQKLDTISRDVIETRETVARLEAKIEP